ncbi:hypothetical protein [Peribacillus sp. NPDC097895]|uniref:hypothetical protein n=1 Tax=Peribacillus sp. NPDC097895 TaxID=3390619 RepID=UPI003CFDCC6C
MTGIQTLENLSGFTYLMVGSQNPGIAGYIPGLPSLGDNHQENNEQDDDDYGFLRV